MKKTRVGIFGCGYVGLAYIALLSKKNYIDAFDVNQTKIDAYKNCEFNYLAEKVLATELKKNYKKIDYKIFNKDTKLDDLDIVFVSVPTNYDENKHQLDVSILDDVILKITKLNPNLLIVIKSTIPFGYTDEIIKKSQNNNIVFMPEFLREGKSFFDLKHPSRVILGCDKQIINKATELLKSIGIINKKHYYLQMTAKEAESVKLFSNTYLAMRVAYFNELDNFALKNQLNCKNMIEGVCLDNRIGNYYNNPSFGFGGYCLEKDTKQCAELFSDNPLIHHIVDSNNQRKKLMVEQILQRLKQLDSTKNSTVGILNLAFKQSSDNYRNSAMISLIQDLQSKNVKVVIFDESITDKTIFGCEVIKDFKIFQKTATLIVANRYDEKIKPSQNVFSRDIFSEN